MWSKQFMSERFGGDRAERTSVVQTGTEVDLNKVSQQVAEKLNCDWAIVHHFDPHHPEQALTAAAALQQFADSGRLLRDLGALPGISDSNTKAGKYVTEQVLGKLDPPVARSIKKAIDTQGVIDFSE
jgi:hypothetical protein